MGDTNPKAAAAFRRSPAWAKEFALLREIALSRPLDEVVKWGWPCYAKDGKNIVLIHGFKDYCALAFFKGALMKDPTGLLIRQTDNVQSARQARFADLEAIATRRAQIEAAIDEAISIEQAGLKIDKSAPPTTPVPVELNERLAAAPKLRKAFEALTPGRRRGYLLHFNAAKQSKTRIARIEKWAPQILAGKGLDD